MNIFFVSFILFIPKYIYIKNNKLKDQENKEKKGELTFQMVYKKVQVTH